MRLWLLRRPGPHGYEYRTVDGWGAFPLAFVFDGDDAALGAAARYGGEPVGLRGGDT